MAANKAYMLRSFACDIHQLSSPLSLLVVTDRKRRVIVWPVFTADVLPAIAEGMSKQA